MRFLKKLIKDYPGFVLIGIFGLALNIVFFGSDYFDFKDRTNFYSNGNPSKKIEKLDSGIIKETYWYESGQKRQEGFFKDGELHGRGISWYVNGLKKAEIEYRNGKKHGKWILWRENGNLLSIEQYIDGKRHGISTLYDYSGNVVEVETYDNGKLIE